jgi:hypothetical protein
MRIAAAEPDVTHENNGICGPTSGISIGKFACRKVPQKAQDYSVHLYRPVLPIEPTDRSRRAPVALNSAADPAKRKPTSRTDTSQVMRRVAENMLTGEPRSPPESAGHSASGHSVPHQFWRQPKSLL